MAEKNEQIDKLIKRVTILHSLNNEFAAEHEKLQNDFHQLQQRCDDYEKDRKNGCDSCRKLSTENDQYQIEIKRLSQDTDQLISDINMMKILIYRLNVQLENYQEIIRKRDGDDKTITSIHNENVQDIVWGNVNFNVLAPLLNAYQESIKEKTNLVKQYEHEINRVTGHLKDIMAENEQFAEDIEQFKQKSEIWTAEKIRLQAQLDVCR